MSIQPGGIDLFHKNMVGVQQILEEMSPEHVKGQADLEGAADRVLQNQGGDEDGNEDDDEDDNED